MTIIRVEYEGARYDLDVLEETPIRVDISAIENSDIGEVFGAASQTFTLPGSKKNNQFFKHAYKVGVTGVPGLGESVPCWVISKSDTLIEGSLFLDEVVKTANGGYNYEVTIVNNVVTFNESVKTVAIRDLDWSEYDHPFSVSNITNSWTDNLFGGDIYYPLIDMGTDGNETTASVPNVSINTDSTVTQGYINKPLTPLQVQQFTPAVRVSTVLDKIFEQGEFSYSSSLQPLFDSLYILPKQTEDLSVKGAGFSDYGFIGAKTGSDQNIVGGTPSQIIEINSETYDPTNSFNTSTYKYTVPKPGTYRFSGSIDWEYGDNPPPLNSTNTLILKSDSTVYYQDTQDINTLTGSIEFDTENINLPKDEEIYLAFRYTPGSVGSYSMNLLSGSDWFSVVTPINYETGTIKIGEQFEPQTKCIDILQGLIQKLNLVIEPIYTENRSLKIETYSTWVDSGKTVDWTQKIQQADRIDLRSPLSSQQKTLKFEDNKDNDKLSKQVIDNAEGFQWGTEVIDAASNVPQGEKKLGTYFAPVVLERMGGTPSSEYSLIPQLYKTDNSQVGKKTFKFKPRLGYKINSTLSETCYIGNDNASFTNYATISNYNAIPIVSGSTRNLHYNESFYPPTFNSSQTGSITAYENYWNGYVNSLYDSETKILNAQIKFEPNELAGIELNDKIFVEDSYYRINKIKGFNVNQNDVVGLELISVLGPIATPYIPDCGFDFTAIGTTTTTSTTTTSTTTTSTTTTTTLPPETVNFTLNNFTTESVDVARVVFSANSEDLFVLNNTAGQSVASTSSVQELVAGSGGVNDISTKWQVDADGTKIVRYDYTQSLNIDGVPASSQQGNIYGDISDIEEFTLSTGIDLSLFSTYSIDLNLRQFSGQLYQRNILEDFDNNTIYPVSSSSVIFSSNPTNLFKIGPITGSSQLVSSSNVDIYTPTALNSIKSNFQWDYSSIIDYSYTASLTIDGSPVNALSGADTTSEPNETVEIFLSLGNDVSTSTSYSIDWVINPEDFGTYRYYTSRYFLDQTGNCRDTVCTQGINEFDNFAFTTESLQIGTQLYENATFSTNFLFETRSGTFAGCDWIGIEKPYSALPTGDVYKINENGVIIDVWNCNDNYVLYEYSQSADSTSPAYGFENPWGDDKFILNVTPATSSYFISKFDVTSPYQVNPTGSLTDVEYFNITQSQQTVVLEQTGSYTFSSLGGEFISSSYIRVPVFAKLPYTTTGSISVFDRYLFDDSDVQTYLPQTSSIQYAFWSPSDWAKSGIGANESGRWPDVSNLGKVDDLQLNLNTLYSQANFNFSNNSIDLTENIDNNNDKNNAGLEMDINSQFNVKAVSILFDQSGSGNTATEHTLLDFRNMIGTFDTSNNYAFLSQGGGNTNNWNTGSMWYSGSYFVYDSTTDTHYDSGFTTSSNMIGTGSDQYPGPGNITSDYGKRIFTFNFNPTQTFTTNTVTSDGIMSYGMTREDKGGMNGNIYAIFLWDTALTYNEHKELTNLLITKNLVSGSIV